MTTLCVTCKFHPAECKAKEIGFAVDYLSLKELEEKDADCVMECDAYINDNSQQVRV